MLLFLILIWLSCFPVVFERLSRFPNFPKVPGYFHPVRPLIRPVSVCWSGSRLPSSLTASSGSSCTISPQVQIEWSLLCFRKQHSGSPSSWTCLKYIHREAVQEVVWIIADAFDLSSFHFTLTIVNETRDTWTPSPGQQLIPITMVEIHSISWQQIETLLRKTSICSCRKPNSVPKKVWTN